MSVPEYYGKPDNDQVRKRKLSRISEAITHAVWSVHQLAMYAYLALGGGAVHLPCGVFIKGRTPFPKWYCVFNPLIGKAVFNSVRRIGSTALINGIATSNMSLGAIVMFTALLAGWKKYAGDREYAL